MQTYELTAHRAFPPSLAQSVRASVIARDAQWLRLRWRIDGSQALVVPKFAGRGRADELWTTTCFELFLKPLGSGAYVEFNFSPSERWAAYDFTGYRTGMSERAMEREPDCTMRQGSTFAIFDAAIPASAIPPAESAMALTAVIEEDCGVKSYWAMAHGSAEKPDFHDVACFAATLAPPSSS